MSANIAIIDYQAGNIHSVVSAFERLGVQPVVTADRAVIEAADKVIFPGVGEAGWAMDQLRQTGLHEVIPGLQQPVLGICLGMQLMCAQSEESNTQALGIFDVPVLRFQFADPEMKVPHMGWNDAEVVKTSPLLGEPGSRNDYYFVHSYYAPVCAFTALECSYGAGFSAMLQRDNFYGVQFHPEKSSVAGALLLLKFLAL